MTVLLAYRILQIILNPLHGKHDISRLKFDVDFCTVQDL